MKTPLYLINGPLGAGKTTFLRQLLRLPEYVNARVIENEFASTSVDTEQLHDHQAEVQTIAGVCICCSTGDELTDALQELSNSTEPVVIEATGVANSLKLIEKIVVADMLEFYDINHAVFILDALEASVNLEETLKIYKNELQAADTVLISKTDLLSTKQLDALMDALQKLKLSQVSLVNDGVFEASLLDRSSNILAYFANLNERIDNHDGDSNYTIIDMTDIAVEVDRIEAVWATLRDTYELRRLKGNVQNSAGQRWHVEATPGQSKITEYSSGALQLVLIGAKATSVHASTIKELVRG